MVSIHSVRYFNTVFIEERMLRMERMQAVETSTTKANAIHKTCYLNNSE